MMLHIKDKPVIPNGPNEVVHTVLLFGKHKPKLCLSELIRTEFHFSHGSRQLKYD